MKLRALINKIETSNENYPITDDFVKQYRQKAGGYIMHAKRACVEPTQKFHFLNSYLIYCKVSPEDDLVKSIGRIRCPELLLYIAESVGLNNDLIKQAAENAKNIIKSNVPYSRIKASKKIKEIIPCNLVEQKLS